MAAAFFALMTYLLADFGGGIINTHPTTPNYGGGIINTVHTSDFGGGIIN